MTTSGGGFGSGGGGGGFRGTPSGREMEVRAPRYTMETQHSGVARAKFDADADAEATGHRRPGLIERFKRWFSNRF